VLLTLDRDFGDLVFHHAQPQPAGVILLRLSGLRPADDNQRIVQALKSEGKWAGRFSVVTGALIRSRTFPPPAPDR
jgi:predicted nuclease of predicted toxin-antitoxin system